MRRSMFLVAALLALCWVSVTFYVSEGFRNDAIERMTTSSTNNCDVSTSQTMTNRAIFASESNEYNFTAAICTAVKDVEAYMEEWIDFHLSGMKFQQIFIYDNSDSFDLKGWYENTRNHPVYSMVEVIHSPGNGWVEEKQAYMQRVIYRDCIERFGTDPAGPQHDYLALIDMDEFLVLQDDKYQDIRGVLQDYLVPYGGALIVNWMLFGTSNHTVYAPIPVTKRFQFRDNMTHYYVKSIVKSTDWRSMRNPHAVNVRNGTFVRTTKYPGAVQTNTGPTKRKFQDFDCPSNVLLLYHYRYLSAKEYIVKRCLRGSINVEHKRWCNEDEGLTLETDIPPHAQPRPGDVFDDKAWKFLIATNPRYHVFQHWEDNA